MCSVTLALAALAAFAQEPAAALDLGARLAAAVDLPTARARAAAARTLAKDVSVPFEAWLAACRAFAPLRDAAALEPGVHTHTIDLPELDGAPRGELVLFVPRDLPTGPRPLVVAMHGTGGEGAHMIGMWSELCERHGALLLCPTEPGPNEGFAGTAAERDAVLAALRWTRRRLDVDEDAVFLTGFSRGGHLTWDLGLRFPDRWAALVPMVGGPRFELGGGKANFRYLENVLHVPLIDLQGARDQAGLVWSVREAMATLTRLGATRATYHEFPDLGHSVDMGAVAWTEVFVQRRAPAPRAFVRRYARAGEGRTAWLECLAAAKTVEEVFVPKVTAAEAAKLDDEGKRRLLISSAEARTGRVEALFVGPGEVRLVAERVTRVRLVLTPEMLGPPLPSGVFELRVDVGGRSRTQRLRPDARVLLEEFVERFDRRFLPVADVEIDTGR